MLRIAVVVGLLVAGCDGEPSAGDSSMPDAGDAGGGDAGLVAAPIPPELPNLGPCAAGWRSVSTDDGFDVCEPFPEAGRATCAVDEAHFPGAPGCERIGTVCPVGDFAEGLATDGSVLYVRPGGAGGDGSEGAPFGTVSEATAVATSGATIALSKGRYNEQVSLPEGVSLRGACPRETILGFDGSSYTAGVVDVRVAAGTISNLRIADSERPGIMVVGDTATATIEDVVIHDCDVGGISAEMGAVIDVENVAIRNMRPLAVFGALGRGLNVETGGRGTVRRLHAEGNTEHAVLVFGDSELDIEDATIVDTSLPAETAPTGSGLTAAEGATLTARRIVIEEATMVGVLVQNEGTDATLEDLVVRRTRPGVVFGGARGVGVNNGATARCTRCLAEDLLEFGMNSNINSSLTLTDVVIRRVNPRAEDDRAGRGASAQTNAALAVERVAIVDTFEGGILADGAGSVLTGSDLTIRRVQPDRGTGDSGRGLNFQRGATGEISRVEIGAVHEGGVTLLEPNTVATITDLWLYDVEPRTSDERFGRGIISQLGGVLTLTRARIERTREFGIAALGDGAQIMLSDVAISDVVEQECSETLCASEPGGHGIGSYFNARVTATRFEVDSAVLCGVQVAEDATMTLDEGLVSHSSIGACLQSAAQDIAQLENGVRYVDNGSNLEATMLPVPMPFDAAE